MKTFLFLIIITILPVFILAQGNDRKVSYGPRQDSEVCIEVNPNNPNTLLATWNNPIMIMSPLIQNLGLGIIFP